MLNSLEGKQTASRFTNSDSLAWPVPLAQGSRLAGPSQPSGLSPGSFLPARFLSLPVSLPRSHPIDSAGCPNASITLIAHCGAWGCCDLLSRRASRDVEILSAILDIVYRIKIYSDGQARALHGNPYDGHTLQEALDDVRNIVGRSPSRVAVDQGYKGHRLTGHPHTTVFITGQRRGITEKIKRWLKRRAVVEPIIGHAKNDGLLGRNWLKGRNGDRTNALLAAVGFNLRQLLRFLRAKLFLRDFLCALLTALLHFSPTPA